MTTPDDTREQLAEVVARAKLIRWGYGETLDETERENWVESETHDPNLLADLDVILAALRDSGWVDPEAAAVLREDAKAHDELGAMRAQLSGSEADNERLHREMHQAGSDNGRLMRERDEAQKCADYYREMAVERGKLLETAEAERDALLPVVEAARDFVAALRYIASGPPGEASEEPEHRYEITQNVLVAAVDALESQAPTVHIYLSTACLHGVHGYCGCDERIDGGKKTPAVCKFHEMPGWTCTPCRCGCHAESRDA